MTSYTTGKQPCNAYDPMDEGSEIGGNEHECLAPFRGHRACGGRVSFCRKCARDHHAGGYESCDRDAITRAAFDDAEVLPAVIADRDAALATIARLTAELAEVRAELVAVHAGPPPAVTPEVLDYLRSVANGAQDAVQNMLPWWAKVRPEDLGALISRAAAAEDRVRGEASIMETHNEVLVTQGEALVAALRRAEAAEAKLAEALGGREKLACHDLLSRGGEWLGAARSWLQRHTRNGESVTWGSTDVIEHKFTVAEIERLASEVAAAAMRPQPSEERLKSALLARWKAERERDDLRALNRQNADVEARTNAHLQSEACRLTAERDEARGLLREAHRAIDPDRWIQSECEDLRARIEAHLGGGK